MPSSRHPADERPEPPAPLVDFLELLGAGRYWESHEVLEGPWRADGSPFYQGLILYASAFVHWRRKNAHGVVAQLAKALERLAPYPSSYLGLDVAGLREHARATAATVERHPEAWASRVTPPSLTLDAARIRGDEAELES